MNLLFVGTFQDNQFLPRLKPLLTSHITSLHLESISTWTEVSLICKRKHIQGIISTSPSLLAKLLFSSKGKDFKPSIENYAGSLFKKDGIEIVFIHPLAQLVTIPYGPFVTKRFISKITSPQNWLPTPSFSWTLGDASNLDSIYEEFSGSYAIAVDIETFKENAVIRCIGYTALFFSEGKLETKSVVIPIDSEYNLTWMRKFNSLPQRKILQNGKYDISYLLRYNAPLTNYLYDTAALMHCWYSELPKDLGFINAFCVRDALYHKDLAKTQDLMEYYEYNARDTWVTALAFLTLLYEMPAWSIDNYLQEFPLQFPCILSEMTGLLLDEEMRAQQEEFIEVKISVEEASLDTCLGVRDFNSNSHTQVKQLLRVLGCKDIAEESSDENHIKEAQFRHPLNDFLLEKILSIRGNRKLISTYLKKGKDFNGRILYTLNPHGTDTGRLASREHHFWCGLQIQNIPRGKDVKFCIRADKYFKLAECDLEQAESRDTAYIAGDESLIAAVSGTRDFHSINASAFFGRKYDEIYSDLTRKTLDKTLRDLAKRVNHGANYLMGEMVLVATMGLKNIYKAARALNLPRSYIPKQIAEYLLSQFHKTYPFLSRVFYPAVVAEVLTTHMLSSKAVHEVEYQATKNGWTRWCFGNPKLNKRHKNAYVAHVPQSLNAMTLNKAYMKVFYELAMHPDYSRDFRLYAQIHDSILFGFRTGHVQLAEKVRIYMEILVTIKGYDGKIRSFTVPASLKSGPDGSGGDRWSELE